MNKIGIIAGDGNLPLYIGKSLLSKNYDVTFLSLNNKKAEGRRLIVGSGVRSILELSKIMAENIPSHAKKLPKKELPNFMVKLISYVDSSVKNLVPDLGLRMQTNSTYAEEILEMKFIEPEVSVVDAAKSVIRLNLA